MKTLIIIGILAFIVIAFTIACIVTMVKNADFEPEIDLDDEPVLKDIQPTKPPIIPPKK